MWLPEFVHSHINLCPWTYMAVSLGGLMIIHPRQVKDNSIYRWEERFSLFMKQQFIAAVYWKLIYKMNISLQKYRGYILKFSPSRMFRYSVVMDVSQWMSIRCGGNSADWHHWADLHLFDYFFALINWLVMFYCEDVASYLIAHRFC